MTGPVSRDLVEVAAGVHVATAPRYTTTSTVLVGGDGTCVAVDPALTRDEVDGLARWVGARGLRTVGGFSTHPHWDHVLWSRELGDGPRWATPLGVEVARREHAALVEGVRALDVLETAASRYGVEVLVPGHGHVTDRAGLHDRLAADRAYLDALRDGRRPDDVRLAEPWVRGEHERQVAALAHARGG